MAHVTRGFGLLEQRLAQIRTARANRLIPEAARNGRLLDVGCGSYPYFLTHTEFAQKYGLDQVVDDAAVARFREQGVTLVTYDAEDRGTLPFESDYFDVVTMLAVFEHIEGPALVRLIREIHRVLKPGGQYLLTTPAAWADPLLRLSARLRLVSPHEIDEHQDRYTHAKVRAILAEGGFDPAHVRAGYFGGFLNLWVTATKARGFRE